MKKWSTKKVMLITTLFVMSFLLGGCGATSKQSSTPGSESQMLHISDKTESTEAIFTTELTEAVLISESTEAIFTTELTEAIPTITASETFPPDFPLDFPLYDKATYREIYREENTQSFPPQISFYCFCSGNSDEILSWYKSELASRGWTITENTNNDLYGLMAQIGDVENGHTIKIAVISESGMNEEGHELVLSLFVQQY